MLAASCIGGPPNTLWFFHAMIPFGVQARLREQLQTVIKAAGGKARSSSTAMRGPLALALQRKPGGLV